jgi:hypothetical protein
MQHLPDPAYSIAFLNSISVATDPDSSIKVNPAAIDRTALLQALQFGLDAVIAASSCASAWIEDAACYCVVDAGGVIALPRWLYKLGA